MSKFRIGSGTCGYPWLLVPGPGVRWWACELWIDWLVFEKHTHPRRRTPGDDNEGRRPKQGDSGMSLGCPEKTGLEYACRNDVYASSLQELEPWSICRAKSPDTLATGVLEVWIFSLLSRKSKQKDQTTIKHESHTPQMHTERE